MNDETYQQTKSYTVKLRERGQLTIPRPVRSALALSSGDTLTFFAVGDLILLATRPLRTPALAEEFSRMMDEEEVSLADLLAGSEEERAASTLDVDA